MLRIEQPHHLGWYRLFDMETLVLNVYGRGLTHASVCTTLSVPDSIYLLNLQHPGVPHWWTMAPIKFGDGKPNPCACERSPDTHQHVLLTCRHLTAQPIGDEVIDHHQCDRKLPRRRRGQIYLPTVV